ncbi:MAG: 23S rRNA (guanosine(2251)-2'-O)-methyltransferase RlmB [Nitrospirae bacterium]|nr:23S rRNA (guanosine(2251)-2'-O)-methyltransferase RlmB [Nitrospirota bacterium]
MKDKNDWIYGINTVTEVLTAGKREIKSLYVVENTRNKRIKSVIDLARAKGLTVKTVDAGFFHRFPSAVHQGICASCVSKNLLSIDDLYSHAIKETKTPCFLLLDQITDPRNLGAILRTADCGGVNGVIIPEFNSSGITPIVEKASSGASEYIHICMVTNIKHAIKFMKDIGILVIGADAEGETLLWDQRLDSSCAIVLGSEGKGLRKTVRESCDVLVRLPMIGHVNSLNVSVAAGIFIFERNRQSLKNKV